MYVKITLESIIIAENTTLTQETNHSNKSTTISIIDMIELQIANYHTQYFYFLNYDYDLMLSFL